MGEAGKLHMNTMQLLFLWHEETNISQHHKNFPKTV